MCWTAPSLSLLLLTPFAACCSLSSIDFITETPLVLHLLNSASFSVTPGIGFPLKTTPILFLRRSFRLASYLDIWRTEYILFSEFVFVYASRAAADRVPIWISFWSWPFWIQFTLESPFLLQIFSLKSLRFDLLSPPFIFPSHLFSHRRINSSDFVSTSLPNDIQYIRRALAIAILSLGISKFTIYLFAFDAFLAFKKLVRDKSIEISRIYIQISDGIVSRQVAFLEKGRGLLNLWLCRFFSLFFACTTQKK